MTFRNEQILQAFRIYTKLSHGGSCSLEEHSEFFLDDGVRGLVEQFAEEVNCTVVVTGDRLLFIPMVQNSPFHISNERLKVEHLPKNALNADIYLMYFSIISLYGMFYDSYHTTEPILEFTTMGLWLSAVNEQVEMLSRHDEEVLLYRQREMNYNWKAIVDKWLSLDDTNERAKKQDARTNSRLSFLNTVKQFLLLQELVVDLGNGEIALTDRSKDIVGKYYMDSEYNREILAFLYGVQEEGA